MVNSTKLSDYDKSMERVCDYIYANLDEELTVKHLSQFTGFSQFHFHRQFSTYMDISIGKYIQLLRLKRASYRLCFDHGAKIIDIAFDAKFDYPESFSRAFKKAFEQSPTEFRRQPNWLIWNDKYQFRSNRMGQGLGREQQVDVVNFTETKIAVYEHKGAPELVNESVARFIVWRKKTGLSPVAKSRTFGIIYDDPKSVSVEEYRFDICGSVIDSVPKNEYGVINKTIEGGRCAVLRHRGTHDNLESKVHYLYGQWLPKSGEVLRGSPVFFHYQNFFPEVAEHDLVTDIYLPLT
ncbi:AraC family transcriptional regulator [Shewanella sp. VB17]|uniref:AraC family transcriptional regulator n=1 Tax=Shewanella sp. VB17 TaxID=2739432 RepID=UPI001563781E|nr:AraC family transcriptional regulator [Shewanella sp. VB17]NRD74981.1 AraC family transcriptional regulator [Shewanella sp. VB17]